MSADPETDKRRIKAKSNTTLQTFNSPAKVGESTLATTAVFSPLLIKQRDTMYSSAQGPSEHFEEHLSGSSPHQQMVSTNFDSTQTPTMSKIKKHSIERMRENIVKIGS